MPDDSVAEDREVNPDFLRTIEMGVIAPEKMNQPNWHMTNTLDKDVAELTLSVSGGRFEWCGMEVILPESYAVERWYTHSNYDMLTSDVQYDEQYELLKTSTVIICPNSRQEGYQITIHDDVTYSTEVIETEANAETIEASVARIAAFAPKALNRFEPAPFSIGTSQDSMLAYYEDLLTVMDQYGYGWLSKDYEAITERSHACIFDPRLEPYDGYPEFNLELLELFQRHR